MFFLIFPFNLLSLSYNSYLFLKNAFLRWLIKDVILEGGGRWFALIVQGVPSSKDLITIDREQRFVFDIVKKIGKIPVVKKMFMAPLPKMKSLISQNVQVVKRKAIERDFFPPRRK